MKNNGPAFLLSLILVIFFFACTTETRKGEDIVDIPEVEAWVPDFNADSAYLFVSNQVDFGPRIPNTPAHYATGNYLIARLKDYGAEVFVQEFQEKAYTGESMSLRNIIASFHPEKSRRILLAAHWDTRPISDKDPDKPESAFDGANDGASGVGVLLEIARHLSENQPQNAGVDIIFFDGEDNGEPVGYNGENIQPGKMYWCLGSQYWSKNKHRRNYMAYYGILLDMVGGINAKFYKEGGSRQFADKILKKVWDAGIGLGYGAYFINQGSPGITDDHIFVNRDAKIPMINIVEYDPGAPDSYFGPYHHTQNDNMDIIDQATLKAVGQTVLYVIYNE